MLSLLQETCPNVLLNLLWSTNTLSILNTVYIPICFYILTLFVSYQLSVSCWELTELTVLDMIFQKVMNLVVISEAQKSKMDLERVFHLCYTCETLWLILFLKFLNFISI